MTGWLRSRRKWILRIHAAWNILLYIGNLSNKTSFRFTRALLQNVSPILIIWAVFIIKVKYDINPKSVCKLLDIKLNLTITFHHYLLSHDTRTSSQHKLALSYDFILVFELHSLNRNASYRYKCDSHSKVWSNFLDVINTLHNYGNYYNDGRHKMAQQLQVLSTQFFIFVSTMAFCDRTVEALSGATYTGDSNLTPSRWVTDEKSY